MIRLRDIPRCFEGEIPAMLATASKDGTPNLGHLTQVVLVDDDHIALSNQFFTKTLENLRENPVASAVVVDPTDLNSYQLLLRHEGGETSGDLFETTRRSIDAIAAMSGMSEIFSLRSVELFRVLDVSLIPSPGNQRADD